MVSRESNMSFTRGRKGKLKHNSKTQSNAIKHKTITSQRKQALRVSKTPSKLNHKERRKIQDRARKKQKINKT